MTRDRPTVLVTRTAPGCFDTELGLDAAGFDPIVSPALEIVPLETPLSPLQAVTGLVFTSANGVRAFCSRSDRRDIVAWCVGPATAAYAQAEAFLDVRNAGGDADDLAAFIKGSTEPESERLIHVANDAAAGNLVRSLRKVGYHAEFAALYTTRPSAALSSPALEALTNGRISTVLVHSAKGAQGFANLIAGVSTATIALVAISYRASKPLLALDWRGIHIAEAPNEDALIKALRMCYTPE
ncbi:MAG: uroporphyrinogen-III synthase [Pseudomonadota bacterium]